jgi:hypothetical protein
MEDMYKQAILDAKAVRASAMANAKATLQEAFEPKIQEMIRMKLSEELEEDLEEDENDPYTKNITADQMGTQDEESWETSAEDTAYKIGIGPEKTGGSLAEDDEVDEASLEEILAELDELAEADDEDAKEDDDTSDDDTSDDAADDSEATEETPTDDTKVIDITLGDLKQVLQSMQGNDMEDMDDMGSEEGSEEDADATLEEINLDEILNSLEEAKMKDKKKDMKKEEKDKEEETKKSLKEAKSTINILRKELNEVNLLNAKLLYMNKIFKSKNLSESQKVNVVSALDRATNTKEAKNIYETLKENIQPKKSQIQESRGFASKPAGVAPKKPILESDAFVSRWQKIAGIK